MGNLLVGVDVGTTATKVIIVDPIGAVLAKSHVGYSLLLPKVGWVEQDPEEIYEGVKKAIHNAVEQLGERKDEISSISFSTQRDTLIATDAQGRPMRNAISWMDSRAGEECAKLRETLGEERVYQITGVPISTIWTYSFILWLRENEPEVWEQTACFGLVHDFLLFRFGAGKHYLDRTNACQTMLFDFLNGCWSEELMSYGGLTADRLPELVEPGEMLGRVSAEVAAQTGLPLHTRLIAGGGDQQCAALGAGVIHQGDIELCIGTAANILAPVREPQLDETRRLICHRALSETYVMEGAMLSTGKLLEWMAKVFFPEMDQQEFFLHLNYEVAANSSPGAGGMLITPHFEGAASPYWDNDARGICIGLTLSTERGDILRAILEGTALEIKKNLNLLNRFGLEARRVVVCGGVSNSPVWLQIIADVLSIEVVTLNESECAAVGAAILAGVGGGVYRSMEHGVSNLVTVSKVYDPRPACADLYQELLSINSTCYESLHEAGIYSSLMKLKQAYSLRPEPPEEQCLNGLDFQEDTNIC